MTDTDVMKVSLDNLHSLLKKIEENQTRLFDTQNEHSKEVERLNGLIEKNTSTTILEIKAINREIQTNAEKDAVLCGVVCGDVKQIKETYLNILEDRLEKQKSQIETETRELFRQFNSNLKELGDKVEGNVKELTGKIDLNTEFRQNMAGFSWVRHGIPVLMFFIALTTLFYSIFLR